MAELTPRQRMVVSTALLMRERGARATSLDAVLEHSGASRGSIYHHFPGGRRQLLQEATDYARDYLARRLERHAADDPLAALDWLLDEYAQVLVASDFRAGCPVVAVAVESGRDDGADLRPNVTSAFDRWREVIADACVSAGIDRGRADELGLLTIASIEGALIMARTYEDVTPLKRVGDELRRLIAAELPAKREDLA